MVIFCNCIIRKCLLFAIMLLRPPPGLLQVHLIGDLGFASRDDEKDKRIASSMVAALSAASCQVVSIPNARATDIIEKLEHEVQETNTVIAVWLLKELFAQNGELLSGIDLENAEREVQEYARKLSTYLCRFQHRMAVIGGSHVLRSDGEKFEKCVLAVTDIMKNQGRIEVLTVTDIMKNEDISEIICTHFLACVQASSCPTCTTPTVRRLAAPPVLRGNRSKLRAGSPPRKVRFNVPDVVKNTSHEVDNTSDFISVGCFLQWLRNMPLLPDSNSLPPDYLQAVTKWMEAQLEESTSSRDAAQELEFLLECLATMRCGDSNATMPTGQDTFIEVHDFFLKTNSERLVDRSKAYTIGRKGCGVCIELGTDATRQTASRFAAFLIPDPVNEMWLVVPGMDIEVEVIQLSDDKKTWIAKGRCGYTEKAFKNQVVCLEWDSKTYFLEFKKEEASFSFSGALFET